MATEEGTDDKASTAGKVAGAGVGAAAGGWLGSSIGIAAFGGAISGLLPLAIVGGVIGWGATKAVQRHKRKAATFRLPDSEGDDGEAK